MGTVEEVVAGVRAATTDTPYIVRETAKGFDLTITDVSNTVNWSAGGGSPRLSASKRVQRGRVLEKSFRKEWGVDLDTGAVGRVVDYTFSSSEGRDLIRHVATAQGWSESRPGVQKGAIVVGVGTVVALVLAFGAFGISALLG